MYIQILREPEARILRLHEEETLIDIHPLPGVNRSWDYKSLQLKSKGKQYHIKPMFSMNILLIGVLG